MILKKYSQIYCIQLHFVTPLGFEPSLSNLFHAFHNVNYTHHQRVNNWEDAVILMETHL